MVELAYPQAQLITSSRLLRLGEGIEFRCHLPPHLEAGELVVYPRYLEQADPGPAFRAGCDLSWVEGMPHEKLPLQARDGIASASYQPREPGSYLACWRVGGETLYRYFAAIEDDWVVLRFSTFEQLQADPPLHATGIAVDYRLPVDRFDPADPLFREFLDYHRRFGCSVLPLLPDTPDLSHEERLAAYGAALERARRLMPDPSNSRSARLEMHHPLDPGYTQALSALGVNDHCGLFEANARPWLGMPEFPYFSSPVDCRKVNQEPGGQVVAHQWDFCAGWHFIGPVSWHFKAAAGNWEMAERCVRTGLDELANAARLSGHPVFAVPLYDGVTPPGYPNPVFRYRPEVPRRGPAEDRAPALDPWTRFDGEAGDDAGMRDFVEQYQRLVAFGFPKQHRVAFARSIDIADYFRRHFRVTPRTVFVSSTDHLLHDMWWLCHWCNDYQLIPRQRLPWLTRMSTVMGQRRDGVTRYKDPLSCEYVLVEDQSCSIRFERECPNPIWWFDYTRQEAGPQGSASEPTEIPDVRVRLHPWQRSGAQLATQVALETTARFPGYAICLWGLPEEVDPDAPVVTSARGEAVLARNLAGEWHLVLRFDLEPGARIDLRLGRKELA